MNSPSTGHTTLEQRWDSTTRQRTSDVAGILRSHLGNLTFQDMKILQAIDPQPILPFASPVLPADKTVLATIFNGYQEVTGQELEALTSYAKAGENYGTAPGEAAALIVGIVRALQPETAFVFGTARGRIEQLIAQNSKAEIATIDLPQEIVDSAKGKPDTNNIRYRAKIGVDSDDKIGDIFKNDPEISGRIHQILGDSFTFHAEGLAKQIRLAVIDGNHSMPNSLRDLATALEMMHSSGGVIMVDDFRKASPLNSGVEAAVVNFHHVTGLPVLQVCPKPGEQGLNASVAVIVVPAQFNGSRFVLKLQTLAEDFHQEK